MTYIIAIDGPSGSGKSTVSKKLAERLNIDYLNTGLMYRAVSKYFLDNQINKDSSEQEIIKILNSLDIKLENDRVYLNSIDVTDSLRTDLINANVSWVSADENVRDALVRIQRKIACEKTFILDGRDIGTVVFPNAKYKFYLTADSLVRAKRRFDQKESSLSIEEIEDSIIKRDSYDSNRKIAPLKKADDAIKIDNSNMDIDQTLEAIISFMDKKDVI